ncbi:MAG TPA: hypothetical protein VJ870_21400 [Amycolatopsis sp.]|nr:hypothetical protein [Amycolatopsis sp.]
MAEARFQMLTVSARQKGTADCVVWRFLSANNRSIAQPVKCFTNTESCLASLRELHAGLARATVAAVRGTRGLWTWRLQVGGNELAAATRTYERRIRAGQAGESFRNLAAEIGVNGVQLVSFAIMVGEAQSTGTGLGDLCAVEPEL